MRKIIVAEFISLNGVIQAPGPEEDTNNGPPAWIPRDEGAHEGKNDRYYGHGLAWWQCCFSAG